MVWFTLFEIVWNTDCTCQLGGQIRAFQRNPSQAKHPGSMETIQWSESCAFYFFCERIKYSEVVINPFTTPPPIAIQYFIFITVRQTFFTKYYAMKHISSSASITLGFRPFNFLNLGTPCIFPEVYFGLYSAVWTTFLPFDCRPKSGPFAFWTWKC
jgi:hypothetical protein